jgi:MFS family permease
VSTRRSDSLYSTHAYVFLFSLRFTEVLWVVYLRGKGLSFAAIGLLETVFHVASFSSEVPTGIVADRWGRKTSLFAGRALAAVSAALVLYARNWGFLAASFAILAVSYTCHSGAFDALVYDSVPAEDRPGFTRLMGKLNSTYLLGTSIAGAGAAFMAQFSLDWLYRAAIAVDVLAALVALSLPEDVKTRREARARILADAGAGVASGFLADVRTLYMTLRRRELRNLLLLWGTVSALATSVVFYGQSLLKESLVPLSLVGIAGTAGNLLAILPTRSAFRLEDRFGQNRALVLGSFSVPAVALAASLVPGKAGWLQRATVVGLYLGLIVLHETMYPLFSNAANARTDSANRATVLSSGSMMFSVGMMVMFPLIGFVGDRMGLRWGIAAAAAFAAICLVPIAVGLVAESPR